MSVITNIGISNWESLPANIQEVLQNSKKIFKDPKELPSYRSIDHKTQLIHDAQLIQVRPYKYPHFQKIEIEKMIKEKLSSDVIRPNTSSFSSHVVLVKKKDGTW